MGVSAQDVKVLRERTGAGLMECKRALVDSDGDHDKAVLLLRERGLAKAMRKQGRTAGESIIQSYIHNDKLGVMLEMACETDFVSRNDAFRELAREVCLQIAAMKPSVVSRDDVPAEVVEQEKAIYRSQAADKPEHVVEKMVEGKLEKFFAEACLLEQPYIRDDSRTIKDLIGAAIGDLGEKIEVRRFHLMEAGAQE